MKIHHGIPATKFHNPVMTIGTFDGIHTGHQRILKQLREAADRQHGEAVVMTFRIPPRAVLNPDQKHEVITTAEEKFEIFEENGVDHLIMLDFDQNMSQMGAMDFFNHYIVDSLRVVELVMGYDHAFGRNREGTIEALKHIARAENIKLTRVSEELHDHRPVSSTWLREEIKKGAMQCVRYLLGRPYSISGTIIKGYGRGKSLGFPTANIHPENEMKLLPADGVYAVTVKLRGQIYKGVLNIGTNPTFGNNKRSIEVYILDFDSTIYNEKIQIFFYDHIREEITFDQVDDLIKQMQEDTKTARNIFSNELPPECP